MPLKLMEPGKLPSEKHEVLINKEEFVIGRGPDCDLQINESEISRHHCMLRTRGEEYTLFDLGSSNGTFLNGHRLISQARLQEGDEVQIGKHGFKVVIEEDDAIAWGLEEGVSPTESTIKLSHIKKQIEELKKREQQDPKPPE